MRDKWFADNRDLVKWSVLLLLAERYCCERILQIAYYRPYEFGTVEIDGEELDLPPQATQFFRNVRNAHGITARPKVKVYDRPLKDRDTYLSGALDFLRGFSDDRSIVFLDPDTGLEPEAPKLDHVLEAEARTIFQALKPNDVFVFYQHQTNRNGTPWIEPKRRQLARALRAGETDVKLAHGPKIARDVVFYYVQRA